MTQKFSECIFHGRDKCDVFWDKKGDIHQGLVSLSMLSGTVYQYSLHVGVDLFASTERSLTMNSMSVSDMYDDNDKIFSYHCCSYGLFW